MVFVVCLSLKGLLTAPCSSAFFFAALSVLYCRAVLTIVSTLLVTLCAVTSLRCFLEGSVDNRVDFISDVVCCNLLEVLRDCYKESHSIA